MQYTLLDLTQAVLSSLDSDEVNSINDSVESRQVVSIIKTVYDDIVTRGGQPAHKTLFNLDASGTATKPVLMTKPSNISNLEWIKYNAVEFGNTDPEWRELRYLEPDRFINFTQSLSPSETDVDTLTHTVNGFTFTINYKNNTAPSYYTTFDDSTFLFDAYDREVDATLQTSKTLAYGTKHLAFIETDGFVPELPADQFALLLNEAKSLAWAELKQTPNNKAEITARKNWTHLAKTRQHFPSGKFDSLAHPFDRLPNFGRK